MGRKKDATGLTLFGGRGSEDASRTERRPGGKEKQFNGQTKRVPGAACSRCSYVWLLVGTLGASCQIGRLGSACATTDYQESTPFYSTSQLFRVPWLRLRLDTLVRSYLPSTVCFSLMCRREH